MTPFSSDVELLRLFLTRRDVIVEGIEALLTAQRKPGRLQQGGLLAQLLEDCFYKRAGVDASQARLRGQLEQAHWAAGFKPRQVNYLYNDLIHPAEMMLRGIHCWQQTRWPGQSGRVHYAQTLFNVYMLRCLQFLSMRLWDDDAGSPGERLGEIQGVLTELWKGSPAEQPAIVRDARWLIPLTQSLITDELQPYFKVARQVTETLPEADVLELQRAHVHMLGGHLASQIRHYCTQDGVPIHERSVVMRTRSSNALDLALLVQGLVGLLQAYDRARQSGDERTRLHIAGAIFQGISPDPELFLNRVDMLGAYSMIELVFIATDSEGQTSFSPEGERHVRLLKDYGALIRRFIEPLRRDIAHFKPVEGRYSPYGVLFGLPSSLIEHMTLKTLQHDAEARFSLEDIFDDRGGDDRSGDDGGTSAAKLAWVNGWRILPHIDPEVQRSYAYPQKFAEDIYNRIEEELGVASGESRTGRVNIVSGEGLQTDAPARYFASSDKQIVAAGKAEPADATELLRGRREGHFLVSYQTPGGWIALKKTLLAEVLANGQDVSLTGLPRVAAEVLRLMCGDLAIAEGSPDLIAP